MQGYPCSKGLAVVVIKCNIFVLIFLFLYFCQLVDETQIYCSLTEVGRNISNTDNSS